MRFTSALLAGGLALLAAAGQVKAGTEENRGRERESEKRPPPEGPGIEEHIPFFQKELGLTAEQIQAVTAVLNENREKMRDLAERRQDTAAELQRLLAAEEPEETAVVETMRRHADITIELMRFRLRIRKEINKILTPEQRERMAELRERMRKRLREAGPRGGRFENQPQGRRFPGPKR